MKGHFTAEFTFRTILQFYFLIHTEIVQVHTEVGRLGSSIIDVPEISSWGKQHKYVTVPGLHRGPALQDLPTGFHSLLNASFLCLYG